MEVTIVQLFKTVLGEIPESGLGVILPHEHICCYFEYFYQMLGSDYLDKEKLINKSVEHLRHMKDKYNVSTLVDCTPVNIGRDIDILKKVSAKAGVNIICSSGFYYTDEAMLYDISEEYVADSVLKDIYTTNAGIIKFAVEDGEMNVLSQKLLSALCTAQKNSGLSLVIHTNGRNKNGRAVIDSVLEKGVSPNTVTIGHLSDSNDLDYVIEILKNGCYAGFDRIYKSADTNYYYKKAKDIYTLCERGFTDKILLSHDGLTFNGFHTNACIREDNPYEQIFSCLIPEMRKIGFTEKEIDTFIMQNPKNMLLCR